jgi:hypothetical protein
MALLWLRCSRCMTHRPPAKVYSLDVACRFKSPVAKGPKAVSVPALIKNPSQIGGRVNISRLPTTAEMLGEQMIDTL